MISRPTGTVFESKGVCYVKSDLKKCTRKFKHKNSRIHDLKLEVLKNSWGELEELKASKKAHGRAEEVCGTKFAFLISWRLLALLNPKS